MDNPCLAAALVYAKNSMHVFPSPPGTKKSYKAMKYSNGRPWGRTIDPKEIERDWKRWPRANVCISTGRISHIFVMDVDIPGEDHQSLKNDGRVTLTKLEKQFGKLPLTRQAISPSGSVHFYFRYPEQGVIIDSDGDVGRAPPIKLHGKEIKAPSSGIDIRGEGGMVVAPPSVKLNGEAYRWLNTAKIAPAPQWLLDLVVSKNRSNARSNVEAQASIEKVVEALRIIPNENASWEFWNLIGMATWASVSGHEDGFAAFDKWSKKCPEKYNEKKTRQAWYVRYAKTPPTRVGFGKLWYEANQESPGWLPVFDEERNNELAIAEENKRRLEMARRAAARRNEAQARGGQP